MKKAENNETTLAIVVNEDYTVNVTDREGLQKFFMDGENLQKLADKIETNSRGLVADPNTKEGASQIKTAARQIASVKKRIDDLGKDVVAELKKIPGVIDKNRKDFRERLEALQDEIRRPVTEIKERKTAIDDIRGTHFNFANADSTAIGDKIKSMEAEKSALKPEIWKESYDEAVAAYDGEISALLTMKGAAEKREKEQRELEELRKNKEEADRILRENKIREEAKEQGKKEALVEMSAAANVETPAAPAPKAPIQSAVPEARPVPMSKTLPQPKPSKWTPEMKAVNSSIVGAMTAIIEPELKNRISGFSDSGYRLAAESVAKELVKAIVNGKIANLKVEY